MIADFPNTRPRSFGYRHFYKKECFLLDHLASFLLQIDYVNGVLQEVLPALDKMCWMGR